MTKEDCIEIGYIARAQGNRGEVKAILDVHDASVYEKVKLLYLSKGNGPMIPTLVTKLVPRSNVEAIITFKGITEKTAAEPLVGSTLFVPATVLPELPDDQFYYFEIKGFEVIDTQKGHIGTVIEIHEQKGNDILLVDSNSKEVLIPMNEEIFLGVSKKAKQVTVNLPEGLLELYLEE